jgi:hypothetical protein
MNFKNSELFNKFIFYCLKQPGIYLLMTTGILLDFMIQSPFIVICALENLFRKKAL